MAAAKPNPTAGQPPNGASIPSSTIPAGLELLQAHIYFRHGERTPVKQRLVHLGLPERFNLCSAGKEFAAGVINAPVEGTAIDGGAPSASTSTIVGNRQNRELMLLRRRVEEGRGTTSQSGHEHECYWGELTDLGRLSTLRLGKQLRALYVDKLGFLPPVLGPEDVDSVYFRATQVPRALESTQQVLHGFWPKQDARVVPTIYQRPIDDESLLPDQGCPTAKAFDRASKKGAAEKYNHTLEPLDGKLAKLVGVPVRIDSHPSANGVFDTIKASQAHGVPVPAVFEDSALSAVLEGAIVKEWFSSYASRQFTKLAMGRLFYELNTRFDDRTEGKSPLKLGLYGCHDTSISGILHALKVQDGRWPAFTAYVSFELFKQEGRPAPAAKAGWLASLFGGGAVARPALDRDHFVRVKYNNAEVRIPACQAEGKHLPGSEGSVCTLEAFKDAVKDLQINSEDWAKACRLPLPADA